MGLLGVPAVSSAPHEFDLIAWIRARTAGHARLVKGIGDDAAVFRFPAPADALITTDMLMEGVDFTLDTASPERVGRKSLAVNLSDIAAMAGKPLACVVSVALPRRGGFALGQGLQAGIQKLADEFGVAVAGGDTNTWDGPLVISITVLGEATERGPVLRSGAKPGDWIMTTGSFGGSLAGKHLDFTPRVREALALHEAANLHAMIDVSDGLAADLGHILEESRVGAILDEGAIPISSEARAAWEGKISLEHALGDGEDFELIFTVSPEDGHHLLEKPPTAVPLMHVGEIVAGTGCRLRDGKGQLQPLPAAGWKHRFEGSPE